MRELDLDSTSRRISTPRPVTATVPDCYHVSLGDGYLGPALERRVDVSASGLGSQDFIKRNRIRSDTVFYDRAMDFPQMPLLTARAEMARRDHGNRQAARNYTKAREEANDLLLRAEQKLRGRPCSASGRQTQSFTSPMIDSGEGSNLVVSPVLPTSSVTYRELPRLSCSPRSNSRRNSGDSVGNLQMDVAERYRLRTSPNAKQSVDRTTNSPNTVLLSDLAARGGSLPN